MGDVTVKRLNLAGLQFLQKFSQVKLWIEETVKIPLSKNPSEFLQSLGDGVLLCKFLNILYPGIIPKIVEKTQGIQAFRATDNIIAFLEGSKKLGFNANQLFQTTDLFMGSHKKNVVKVIYSLSEFQKFLKVLPPITTKITEEDVNQLKNNLQKHELDSLLQVPISRSGNDEQEKNPFFNSFFDPDMSGPSSPICQISEDFFYSSIGLLLYHTSQSSSSKCQPYSTTNWSPFSNSFISFSFSSKTCFSLC